MIRVLLVDDHDLVRAGIRALLSFDTDVEVVGEADGADAAIVAIERLRPDVVLLDISLGGQSGLEVARTTRTCFPGVRVVMLSMYGSPEYVGRALEIGVHGYLLKGSAPDELGTALGAVMRGNFYLSPKISHQVIEAYREQQGAAQLTERQQEVLKLLASGWNMQAIAAHLCLSVKTVETHRAHLMKKLGIHDLASLTHYAIRIGLVTLEP